MKHVKKLLFILLGVVLVTMSCNDDFSEIELLGKLQNISDDTEAARQAREDSVKNAQIAANIEALNKAGKMLDYTVTVHTDDVPVAGISVTATNQDGELVKATSDEDGNAIFTDMTLGGHTIVITSPDYLNMSYLVDFGRARENVHYEIVNGEIIPIKVSEASKIELFGLNGLQTATIKGKVEIETNLTNNTFEIPQDITLRANLDGDFEGQHTNNETTGQSIYVSGSFTFTQGDIGEADVDNTTGEYSMNVPALDGGTKVNILLPLIEADQTLAYSEVNGVFVGAQVGTQPAYFGPDITASDVPDKISGVTAVFPEPAPAGRGFTVGNFQPLHRGISSNGTLLLKDLFPVDKDTDDHFVFRGTEGEGYQTSPVVTVDAPDLTGAKAVNAEIVAHMNWDFNTVTIAAAGTGYPLAGNAWVVVDILDSDNTVQDTYNLVLIPVNGAGGVVTDTYDVNITTSATTDYVVSSFVIRVVAGGGTGAGGTLARTGKVNSYEVTEAGDGYTTIPGITLSGGGATTDATLEITDMAFQYSFDLDNSGVSQAYVVLPEIGFSYEKNPGYTTIDHLVDLITVDDNNFTDLVEETNNFLENLLVVSGDKLLFDNTTYFGNNDVDKARTDFYSFSTPSPIIIEPEHEQAAAVVEVVDGQVTGFVPGTITAGRGYTQAFDVTIMTLSGLPGSGASIQLIDLEPNFKTGEVIWDGDDVDYIVQSPGSDYTIDVNINSEEAPVNPSVEIKNGETKIVNINYGTGATKAKLN